MRASDVRADASNDGDRAPAEDIRASERPSEGDSAPFPSLESPLGHLFEDPLVATTDAPPPLPSAAEPPHLQVVDDDKTEAGAFDEETTLGDLDGAAAPVDTPSVAPGPRRRRPRTGSRPVVREHSRARPASAASGRAFGTNPPRGPTPLPDANRALQAQLDDYTPALRREESVIEEAAALRHGHLHRVHRFVDRLRAALKSTPTDPSDTRPRLARVGLRLASSIGTQTLSALGRFERLPKERQLVLALAPYIVALVLLVVLVGLRGGELEAPALAEEAAPATAGLVEAAPAAPEAKADAPAEAPATEATATEAPATEAPATEVAATEAPATEVAATETASDEATAPAEPVEAKVPELVAPAVPAAMPSEARILPRRSKLFVRADAKSRRPIRLRKGTPLTVFPSFPAPEGWRLVQTKKGTVGFVSALHLDDAPDPAVDAKRRRRRRR